MKVIIFNDKENFDGSLNLINQRFKPKDKRFWNYEKYIPFLVDKLKSIDQLKKADLQLTKTIFYTGKYTSKLINSFKWSCNQKIAEFNLLIQKQQGLLNHISQQKLPHQTRRRINNEFEAIKKTFENKKSDCLWRIEKHRRNFEGQKDFFEIIAKAPFIEMKTTPLKQSNGEIYQKGVDVMIATDLVNLAHTNAYDIALILGGDTDLMESIKLIKTLGKTAIIVAYYTPGDPRLSNISDLIGIGDYFINLKDFTDAEIVSISDLRK